MADFIPSLARSASSIAVRSSALAKTSATRRSHPENGSRNARSALVVATARPPRTRSPASNGTTMHDLIPYRRNMSRSAWAWGGRSPTSRTAIVCLWRSWSSAHRTPRPALLDHSRQAHQRDRHSAEKDLKREYGLRGPLRHEDPALARAGDDRQQRRRDEADAESARPEADRRPEEERQQDRDRSGQLRRQPQPELRRIPELTHTRQEQPAGEQARLEKAG